MAIMEQLDDLFGGNLDSKMDFLAEKKALNSDGIYRVDLTKVKDKKKGWKSVIRFLPNLTKERKVGQSAIEKIAHYVDIKNVKELSGWFDSPKNFDEKCPLSDLYYTMTQSKNAILVEKAKCLKYSKKYYSYILVLEDEQQPELVGKIMIYQYGKTIKDKIQTEKNGEITGIPCNVFDLEKGKDFVILANEISTGDDTYPDYKKSTFKPETSPISIWSEKNMGFKQVPLTDGKISPDNREKVCNFLLNREHELEEYSPKRLTEEQQEKITEITNFLTGKASKGFNNKPKSDDFDLEEFVSSGTKETAKSNNDDDDDFFNFD